ncbi:hypothetical protein WN943_007652 [Citrus x changshan-huyou]
MVPEDGDEDDETTEILLKFRDQIRNLLFKKTNESNEPEPGTLIWLLFNGMLCTLGSPMTSASTDRWWSFGVVGHFGSMDMEVSEEY